MDYVASAVMHKEVKTVTPCMTLPNLEARFASDRVSGFAVVDEGKLVGVVSHTDVIEALHAQHDKGDADRDQVKEAAGVVDRPQDTRCVEHVMTRDVVTVPPNAPLHDLADLMYAKRIHRVFVVDDEKLVGVVTPFDFVKLYSTDWIGADGRAHRTPDF